MTFFFSSTPARAMPFFAAFATRPGFFSNRSRISWMEASAWRTVMMGSPIAIRRSRSRYAAIVRFTSEGTEKVEKVT